MVDKIHYRWDFIGLSTDEKPTSAESPKVVNGSTYYESDTSKLYVFYKDTWYEKTATGGGGGTSYTAGEGIDITNNEISVDTTTIQPKLTAGDGIDISNDEISVDTTSIQPKLTAGTNITIDQNNVISATGGGGPSGAIELTDADYNWPEDNPDHVSLFKLNPGLYYRNSSSVKVSIANDSYLLQDNQCMTFLVVRGVDGAYPRIVYLLSSDRSDDFIDNPGMNHNIMGYRIWHTGTSKSRQFAIADNLTTDESFSALSAKQGKALDDKITALTARVSALEGN